MSATKSASSSAHSAQNAQVSQWRTRPIGWPSRRRNRLLCICTLHSHIAAHQHARRPRARGHAPGGGRAGSRRGIRTRRRMQAGMDTCGLAHASEAAPGRQERRPAPRWEPAAPLGTCRRLPLRIPIPSIGNPQFWAGVDKPPCPIPFAARFAASPEPPLYANDAVSVQYGGHGKRRTWERHPPRQ